MIGNKTINRNSDLFAIFIAETLVCSMIASFITIPLISVIMTIALVVCVLATNRHLFIEEKTLAKVFVIIAILLISAIVNGFNHVVDYAIYFICFGMASLVFASVRYRGERVIQSLVKIYFLYVLVYLIIIRNRFLANEEYWSEQMGIAYGFVPIAILSVLALMCPGMLPKQKKTKWLCILTGILSLLFILLDTGTRGAIVTIVFAIMFIIFLRVKGTKKVLLVITAAVVSITAIAYYKEIIIAISNFTKSMGFSIGAIEKMVFMISQGNELNGRDSLAEAAKEYFMSSPIYGYGVGFFEKKEGTYPHNVILQLLCEYGILGTTIIIVFMLKRIVKLFFSNRTDAKYKYIEVLAFLSSVPMLFFSNTYWQLPLFWIFFFSNQGKDDNCLEKNIL